MKKQFRNAEKQFMKSFDDHVADKGEEGLKNPQQATVDMQLEVRQNAINDIKNLMTKFKIETHEIEDTGSETPSYIG